MLSGAFLHVQKIYNMFGFQYTTIINKLTILGIFLLLLTFYISLSNFLLRLDVKKHALYREDDYKTMPFQMTHLHIAKNIYKLFPEKINNLPQFYLGNIAPDGVHNREGYISDWKKASHLCVGDEPWGLISNNDEWIENVQKFLTKHRDSNDFYFILGYCCHILSDIYNNVAVWTPFLRKNPDQWGKGYSGVYHQESEKVDKILFLRDENNDDFWVYLEKSRPIDLYDFISAEEIEKHKENLLYNWYKDKELPDISAHKLITLESINNFIEGATNFIVSKIASLI